MEEYEIHTLPNGVRIVAEHVPDLRSAALGIWVGTGSRSEKPSEGGAAHFIEHMVFKGTARRTAAELAQAMDAIGGQVNAYTTKECTTFYARCLDDHLPRALDLLCDMVFQSRFDEKDVQTERGVILEEIGMYEDNPEDLCSERLLSSIYKGTALGRPILGKKATLEKMTGEWLKDYQDAHYLPGNIVVSLAGSFPDFALEELKARFVGLSGGRAKKEKPVAYQSAFAVKKKAIEQNHLTLAFPGLAYGDERRFALQLLSSILGGGMSSRLFQEVREKRGLCYSVYSYGAGHAETGVFGIYTALNKEMEVQAMETICAVIRNFAEHGPQSDELERARELSKANVLMGLESTQARMSSLGRGTLLQDRPLTTDDVIAAYNAVTTEDVKKLAEELFDFKTASLSAVGRVGDEAYYRNLIGV